MEIISNGRMFRGEDWVSESQKPVERLGCLMEGSNVHIRV